MNDKVSILGVNIDKKTKEEFVSDVANLLNGSDRHMVFTPNPEMIVRANKDIEFKNVLNLATLSLPDGIGLLFASTYLNLKTRFRKSKKLKVIYALFQAFYTLLSLIFFPNFCRKIIKERVCGSDFFWELIRICNENQKRVFFLGAAPGVSEMVRDRVMKVYPKLQIAGTYAGSPDKDFEKEICHIINTGKPDLLCIAYGAPAQEKWIYRNLKNLDKVKVAIGLGGTFDFVAGKTKRAPLIMRKLGLEWLFRLLLTPSRIYRIYNATFKFVKLVIKEKIYCHSRLSRRGGDESGDPAIYYENDKSFGLKFTNGISAKELHKELKKADKEITDLKQSDNNL